MKNKIWLITDTHFGVSNNSKNWLEIQTKYFYDEFIPILKEHSRPGDILVHCGDIFDNRQSLNLNVMNTTIQIFKDIVEILPVHMICGNHDIYMKSSNDINSLRVLEGIPGISVYTKPTFLDFQDTRLFFLPWIECITDLKEIIRTNSADVLFCHCDFSGSYLNAHSRSETGAIAEEAIQYRKIYCGHIHYSQSRGNLRILGTPYSLTRSDAYNPKGIWSLNLNDWSEDFYENQNSPRFLKFSLSSVEKMSDSEILQNFENNFVDIYVSAEQSLKFNFTDFTNKFQNAQRLQFFVVPTKEIETQEHEVSLDAPEISLRNLVRTYVDNLSLSESVKKKLISESLSFLNTEKPVSIL